MSALLQRFLFGGQIAATEINGGRTKMSKTHTRDADKHEDLGHKSAAEKEGRSRVVDRWLDYRSFCVAVLMDGESLAESCS
jgi:hypothetical protein